MSYIDPTKKIYDSFENYGNLANKDSREKFEQLASMLGSIGVAEAIPGVGEIQMASMFIDFLDPYGYNQALTQDVLEQYVWTPQYNKIIEAQNNVTKCYTSGDSTACTAVGITPDKLASYKSMSPTLQALTLKSRTSILTPADPVLQNPQQLSCQLSTSPDSMNKECTDDLYKNTYLDFYNKNAAAYQADYKTQQEASSVALINELKGDTPKNNNFVILVVLYLILLIGFYYIFTSFHKNK
jgi:hypothetical protein